MSIYKKSSFVVALFLVVGCISLEASVRECLLQETAQSIFTQRSPEEALYGLISRWSNVVDGSLFDCLCTYIEQDCGKGYLNAQKNVLGLPVTLESQLKSLEKSSPERARRIMRAIAVEQIKHRNLSILGDSVVYQGTEALYVQWYNQTNYLDKQSRDKQDDDILNESFYSDSSEQTYRLPLSFTKKGLQGLLLGALGVAALTLAGVISLRVVSTDRREVVVRY